MVHTEEMEQGAEAQHLGPPQARFGEPPHEHGGERAHPHEGQVGGGGLVVVVAQLDGAEEDHVADDAEEGEPLAEFHQQDTHHHLELLPPGLRGALWGPLLRGSVRGSRSPCPPPAHRQAVAAQLGVPNLDPARVYDRHRWGVSAMCSRTWLE